MTPMLTPFLAQLHDGLPVVALFAMLVFGFLLICLLIGGILVIAKLGQKHGGGVVFGIIGCLMLIPLVFMFLVFGYSTTSQVPATVTVRPMPMNSPNTGFDSGEFMPVVPPEPVRVFPAAPPEVITPGSEASPLPPSGTELLTSGSEASGPLNFAPVKPDPTQPNPVNRSAGLELLDSEGLKVERLQGASVSAWNVADTNEFAASVYPGRIDCARPLARQLREIISTCDDDLGRKTDSSDPQENAEDAVLVCDISGDDSFVEQSARFLDRFTEQLRKDHPEVQFRVVPNAEFNEQDPSEQDPSEQDPSEQELSAESDDTASSSTGHIQITLGTELESPSQTASWNPRFSMEQGRVICRLQCSESTSSFEARFLDKPWVFHFDRFISESPEKHYVVGYSPTLASTESEARRLAMESAQSQVRIAAAPGVPIRVSDHHVVDRFAQKLSRPYGDVWRQAVLVDVTGDAMRRTASVAVSRREKEQEKESRVLFVLAVMVGLTIAVCVVTNALTQGYYRNHLSAGAGGLIVLVITTLLFFVA